MHLHHKWINIKKKKKIAGRKKSLLNPLLLPTVSELHFLPGSIPWGLCSVHRPSCSRNCHLDSVHSSSNQPWSGAGRGSRVWYSPWSGWQQCPDSPLPVLEHQGSKAQAASQHNKMQGDSVEGKGKSGRLCHTACSLCCSFSLKMLFDHRSKIILSPPSFQGCSDAPGLQSQSRGSSAQRALSSSSQHRAHPDTSKWGHSDSLRAQGSGVSSLLW